jgi:hypothetical protein
MAPGAGPADDRAKSARAAAETFDDVLTRLHIMQPPIVIVKTIGREG